MEISVGTTPIVKINDAALTDVLANEDKDRNAAVRL